jgi:hypothetical protein
MSNDLSFSELVAWARESGLSSFYRDHWNHAATNSLPPLAREKFAAVGLRAREYKKKKGIVSVIRVGAKPYLWKWALEDLQGDYLRSGCRPLLLFSRAHDAIEKPLTLFRKNILALNGTLSNPSVTLFAAANYHIDSVLADSSTYVPGMQMLAGVLDSKQIVERTVFVESGVEFRSLPEQEITHLLLSLPETGSIARLCEKHHDIFHAEPDMLCEAESGELIVTRLARLVTPVIRLATGIAARAMECECGKKGFVLA